MFNVTDMCFRAHNAYTSFTHSSTFCFSFLLFFLTSLSHHIPHTLLYFSSVLLTTPLRPVVTGLLLHLSKEKCLIISYTFIGVHLRVTNFISTFKALYRCLLRSVCENASTDGGTGCELQGRLFATVFHTH